jgi:erythromycin esterase-like protein
VIAHNAHVMRAGEQLAEYVYPLHWKNMGSYLGDRLGADYAPFALLGTDVTSSWPGMPVTTTTAEPGSLEAAIGGDALVDLTAFSQGTAALPFGNPARAVGVPSAHFAGAFHLAASGPMDSYVFASGKR